MAVLEQKCSPDTSFFGTALQIPSAYSIAKHQLNIEETYAVRNVVGMREEKDEEQKISGSTAIRMGSKCQTTSATGNNVLATIESNKMKGEKEAGVGWVGIQHR